MKPHYLKPNLRTLFSANSIHTVEAKNCYNPCLNWQWHAVIHVGHIILVEYQCQANVNFEKPKNIDKIK